MPAYVSQTFNLACEVFEGRRKVDAVAAVGRVELDEEGGLRAENRRAEISGLQVDDASVVGSVKGFPLADSKRWNEFQQEQKKAKHPDVMEHHCSSHFQFLFSPIFDVQMFKNDITVKTFKFDI